ncbi:hypothetical protein MAE30S32_38950 [Microcystis aeruginosa 11-30S32]|uniref:Uncharacterized protein n=1 Tax=Microcystis aeruginosa 11-30S32 TaxID=2358142 RepID=A0A510PP62_MICAE|nr:hypothetical protein MAE30S32_38950 [Microcystis aeruginosa 11-30S32]
MIGSSKGFIRIENTIFIRIEENRRPSDIVINNKAAITGIDAEDMIDTSLSVRYRNFDIEGDKVTGRIIRIEV